MTGYPETDAQSNEEALQSTENKIKETEKGCSTKRERETVYQFRCSKHSITIKFITYSNSSNKKELASTEKQIS